MSGHTPGPWVVREGSAGSSERPTMAILRPAPHGNLTAVYIGARVLQFYPRASGSHRGERRRYGQFSEQDRANARLIAAAPELLEALRTIVANARMIPDPRMEGATDVWAVPLEDIEVLAHAAISKADGK